MEEIDEMEEIDPRAFNSGADDSGLPIAHTYVNNGSNSKLYPSSKKARKSLSNLDAKVCLLLLFSRILCSGILMTSYLMELG